MQQMNNILVSCLGDGSFSTWRHVLKKSHFPISLTIFNHSFKIAIKPAPLTAATVRQTESDNTQCIFFEKFLKGAAEQSSAGVTELQAVRSPPRIQGSDCE
jgi:hypothetical protein